MEDGEAKARRDTPHAIANNRIQTSKGDRRISVKLPMNHRTPSPVRKERTPVAIVTDSSHDISTNSTSAVISATAKVVTSLLFIRFEIVNVYDVQLQRTNDQTGGIDASRGIGEQLLHQLVLSLFKAFDPERHPAQLRDLILGIA